MEGEGSAKGCPSHPQIKEQTLMPSALYWEPLERWQDRPGEHSLHLLRKRRSHRGASTLPAGAGSMHLLLRARRGRPRRAPGAAPLSAPVPLCPEFSSLPPGQVPGGCGGERGCVKLSPLALPPRQAAGETWGALLGLRGRPGALGQPREEGSRERARQGLPAAPGVS